MWDNAGGILNRVKRAWNKGDISEGFYASQATFDDFIKTPIANYNSSKWSEVDQKEKLQLWKILQTTKDILPLTKQKYMNTELYTNKKLPYNIYKEFHPRSDTYLNRSIFSKGAFDGLDKKRKKNLWLKY